MGMRDEFGPRRTVEEQGFDRKEIDDQEAAQAAERKAEEEAAEKELAAGRRNDMFAARSRAKMLWEDLTGHGIPALLRARVSHGRMVFQVEISQAGLKLSDVAVQAEGRGFEIEIGFAGIVLKEPVPDE